MGLACCDRCWERPCVCGYEREQAEKVRREYYADMAKYRKQLDTDAIEKMPKAGEWNGQKT